MRHADSQMLLTGTGWLSRTPPAFQRAMFDMGVWREVDAGSTIIMAGDNGGGLWAVARGQIDIVTALSTPDAPPAHIGQPGSWWGAAPVFGRPRNASATTRTPALLAQFPLAGLNAMLVHKPGWWQYLGALVLDLMELASGAASDLLIRNARQRCIAVLLRVTDCRARDPLRPPPYSVTLSHSDLALMANLSRYPVGEILRDLDREGLIELGYRTITVVDGARLREIVDA